MKKNELAKRVKDLRSKRGFSQEQLAGTSGLSLRTIQRIESGETEPRGDTLKRLSVTLEVSPDEIIDWQESVDKNVLTVLNLSQLGFLAFPLLGIILPLAIWINKKEKVKYVNENGKAILNFQITWLILVFVLYVSGLVSKILHLYLGFPISGLLKIIGGLYAFNVLIIIVNTIRTYIDKTVIYKPTINFLR